MAGCDLIVLVAMHDPQALAAGSDMNVVSHDIHRAKRHTHVVTKRLVVIARYKNYFCTMARHAQYFLHDGVMRGGPVKAAFHGPHIDDVADQVQVVALVFAQEREQPLWLTRSRAEVYVGQEQGANAFGRRVAPGFRREARRPFGPSCRGSVADAPLWGG